MNSYYIEEAKKMSLGELDQLINMTAENYEKEGLLALPLPEKIQVVADILDRIVEETDED